MEFPYDRDSFKDRYTRQNRNGLCSTIVAHLKKDGLMFIHPTQVRSFTPREAARVQTFADTFQFVGSRSDVFNQIGNAVPPLVGKKIGQGVLQYLSQSSSKPQKAPLSGSVQDCLIAELEEFVNKCLLHPIDFVHDETFKDVWQKIHQLLPHLHPESALDNGKEISSIPNRSVSFCLEPYFTRSGWPCELASIAIEASRRHKSGLLSTRDYYHESPALL